MKVRKVDILMQRTEGKSGVAWGFDRAIPKKQGIALGLEFDLAKWKDIPMSVN